MEELIVVDVLVRTDANRGRLVPLRGSGSTLVIQTRAGTPTISEPGAVITSSTIINNPDRGNSEPQSLQLQPSPQHEEALIINTQRGDLLPHSRPTRPEQNENGEYHCTVPLPIKQPNPNTTSLLPSPISTTLPPFAVTATFSLGISFSTAVNPLNSDFGVPVSVPEILE